MREKSSNIKRYKNNTISRGSYGQKDVFSAMSLETGPLIGHDSIMCKDQEYVRTIHMTLSVTCYTNARF